MRQLTLRAQQAKTIDVDVCDACHAFWFDQYESLQLTPGSTLELFTMMADQGTTSPVPAKTPACPRCRQPMILAHDYELNTPFQYWRCEAGHGRFITFVEFL